MRLALFAILESSSAAGWKTFEVPMPLRRTVYASQVLRFSHSAAACFERSVGAADARARER
jgi:hypothetical protein